ncbi:hypothetical protein [Microbulbifer sp. Q7]|uniref:hypothetical protein n=1 Tax=Microbulbifer sp. Q7 TaxID=1785091 RepID=UPI0008334876|nr:hypothetical protein [Microbulbifer sp. Q7]
MNKTLEQHFEKVDRFLKTQTPRMGQGKIPKEIKSNIADNESAKMTTSKGIIQGYNGIAAVDKKHQIIVETQAFGEGQETHTLKPIKRYRNAGVADETLADEVIFTEDTGFSSESNNDMLREEGINAYIPDNQFRARYKAFAK